MGGLLATGDLASMKSYEFSVQFLDLGHQIGVKASDQDPRISKAKLAPAANCIVRIERPDIDLAYAGLDYAVGASDLRRIARSTRFQGCVKCRARQCRSRQFLF